VNNSLKAYPELRGLLAKYNMTFEDLGKVINRSSSSMHMKMNDIVKFSCSEIKMIRDFFRSKGEKDITADKIFFDWQSTIVDKEVI
jgi:hypothetical protein